ncbi:MAG: DUF2029 domain-containing protein [Actinomycetota bacterium]|nr:DUF2029 domain-containing protein [Actinomycetota bacterium]
MLAVRKWWFALASMLGLVGGGFYLALTAPLGADYPGPPCDVCDFAGPPIESLSRGDVGEFFSLQPVMGSVSLVLRAPFVALARVFGGGEKLGYQLGALACLLLAAGFAWLLMRAMARRGQSRVVQVVVAALVLGGPLSVQALKWGHPEELLAAGLCIGGVIAAARQRPTLAGVLIGLAFATKLWAWLAFLPALIVVASGARLRFSLWAAGAAALFVVPMFLGDPGRFMDQIHHYGVPGNGLTPTNIWWVYGHEAGQAVSSEQTLTGYALPALIGRLSHILVVVVALALTALYWWKRRDREPLDVLQLVALIFLLRCLLDPLTYSYHHIPFFVALIAYEGLRRRGLPWISMVVSGVVLYMTERVAPEAWHNPTVLNRWYLAWAVPVAAYLAFSIALPDGVRWDWRRRLHPLREVVRADDQPVAEVEAVGVGTLGANARVQV